MKLFLDACIIIYWVEMVDPFYKNFLRSLNKINELYPQAPLVASRLSLLECYVKPLQQQDKIKLTTYRDFFENPSLEIIEITPKVVDLAISLRAEYGLKTPDALQVGSALSLGNGVTMVTNDQSLKKIKHLSVITI